MKVYYLLLIIIFTTCQSEPQVKKPVISLSEIKKNTSDTLSPLIEEEIIEKVIVPDYDTTKWADLALLDPSIIIDMRYATKNNFVEEKMYECGRCFLRPTVAKAVIEAHKELQKKGLGFKMYDCYRPRPIQWKLWNKVPDARYVSDPRKGSMHNRGAAVDLTIVDKEGKELEMGTDYDFFGRRAYQTYTDLPDTILANRTLLRETLAKFGFRHIRTEWWHYAYRGKGYPLSDMLWNCEE